MKQLAVAMHSYNDVYKMLPPHAVYSEDGKPLLSWRVLMLPFLEQEPLYKKFKLDEPWDSPHNLPLLAEMPPFFKPVYAGLFAVADHGLPFFTFALPLVE